MNGKYDFFKYNGKLRRTVKVSPGTNFIIHKVENHQQLVFYFLANQIDFYLEQGKYSSFLMDFSNEHAVGVFKKFLNTLKISKKNLYSELQTLFELEQSSKLGDFEQVLKLFYDGKLSLTTIIYLYKFGSMKSRWQTDHPLYSELLSFIEKIEKFFDFRKENFTNTLKKVLHKN